MEREIDSGRNQRKWRLSWTAYLGPLFRYGMVIGILIAILDAMGLSAWWLVAIVAGRLIFRLAELGVKRVILDDTGVWVREGIMPWSKGMFGVKWRDIDQAECSRSFLSWATNSYTVRVGHRFTKGAEIIIPHVAGGRRLIHEINGSHEEMDRRGLLT